MSKTVSCALFLALLVLSSFAFNAQELTISNRYLIANAASDPLVAITNITLSKHTRCIAVNNETNRVYVGVDGGVIVISGETDQIIAEIPMDDEVRALAVNPQTNRIYAGVWLGKITL